MKDPVSGNKEESDRQDIQGPPVVSMCAHMQLYTNVHILHTYSHIFIPKNLQEEAGHGDKYL